jgi:hypothetical protein
MRRAPALLALLLLASFPGLALDFGLDLSNSDYLAVQADQSLSLQLRATAWASLPLWNEAGLYASGFYEYKSGSSGSGGTITPWRFDLGKTEFEGSISSLPRLGLVLRWSLGRLELSDFSDRILSGLYDGERLQFALGNLNLGLAVAYTGLLFKDDALLALDAEDVAINNDAATYYAPKHLIGAVTLRLSEILPGHDFGVEGWGQIDLETGGSTTESLYAEPFIEGRFGRSLRWRAWGIYEYLWDGTARHAVAAGASVLYSMPELLGLRVTGSVDFASGPGTVLASFVPIRRGQEGSVSGISFTNCGALTFSASLSPLALLSASAGASLIVRTSEALIDSLDLRADATGYILGVEATLRLSLRLATDLNLGLGGGIFLPETLAYYKAGTLPRLTGTLSTTLSL